MCQIRLENLNFERTINWLTRAKDWQKDDPVDAFICAWIAFSHWYGTYCARKEVKANLYQHAGIPPEKYISDFRQLLFLCDQPDFRECFREFKNQNESLLRQVILFPVDRMERIRPGEKTKKREESFMEANAKKMILTFSTIRINLFHGYKDPFGNDRDKELCAFAASIMVPFVEFLLKNTEGKVENAYSETKSQTD